MIPSPAVEIVGQAFDERAPVAPHRWPEQAHQGDDRPVADADAENWVNRLAPAATRPYLRLMRADRPIGVWLLFLPFCWALALAAAPGQFPSFRLMCLFFIVATVMRGAGCTVNDIVDRELDAQVERTRSRPLPGGQVSVIQASIFATALFVIGIGAMATTNRTTWLLITSSLVLIMLYPFMKRITWWPQAFLGLTFNWGALLGWAAVHNRLDWPVALLYLSGAFWTFGYDTIYAHQDKVDDEQANIRSSARALGSHTRWVVSLSYASTIILAALAGISQGFGMWFIAALIPAGIQLAKQVTDVDLDNSASCLRAFKSNRNIGLWMFAAFIVGQLMR